MTESELKAVFSENLKKYRKGLFTQESLAEQIGVSSQNINDIEGKRRFPRPDTLVKIAATLNVEVYQLFVPQDKEPVAIKKTPENQKIRSAIQKDVVQKTRRALNRILDKMEE
ncbi:MAG: helix-turn-helix transcriptional regulator [Treponema sp.]|nr:helix-turn-helix transcriptional regulator [Treponema sp.]